MSGTNRHMPSQDQPSLRHLLPTRVRHSTGRIFCTLLARGEDLPDNCERIVVCVEGRGRRCMCEERGMWGKEREEMESVCVCVGGGGGRREGGGITLSAALHLARPKGR